MAKGGDWERDASKALSLWWTEGQRDDVIWRTAGSGARATVRRKVGKHTTNAYGDLGYTHPIAKPLFDFMLIECKRGYAKARPSDSINVLYWLDRPTNTKPPLLYQWWCKLEKECRAAKVPYGVILFRRTGKRASVMLEDTLFDMFANYCNSYNRTTITIEVVPGYYPNNCNYRQWGKYVIMDLTGLLDWVSPQTVTTMLEAYKHENKQTGLQKRKLR